MISRKSGLQRLVVIAAILVAVVFLLPRIPRFLGIPNVTVFKPADGSLLSSRSTYTIAAGVSSVNVAVDPGGKFAYVVGVGCGGERFLSTYSINLATGVLTNAGRDINLGDGDRHFVAVDPSGKFVYTANLGNVDDKSNRDNEDVFAGLRGSVKAFAINTATGELTFAAWPVCGGSCVPSWLAVDPSGKFVYVADEGGSGVWTLRTSTTGALALEGVTNWGHASSVAVDPSGKFVYVTNGDLNNVAMYATGVLTSTADEGPVRMFGKTIAAGTTPSSVTVDPFGKWVYVTNAGSNNVSMYGIDAATGSLTSTGLIAAGTKPVFVAVDPTGKFAYVTNAGSNDVSMYSISTANGTLTSVGTIAGESSPGSIAIHPSGKFAYVTNSGSNTVSMYSVDATTGTFSLIGKIGTDSCDYGGLYLLAVLSLGPLMLTFRAWRAMDTLNPQLSRWRAIVFRVGLIASLMSSVASVFCWLVPYYLVLHGPYSWVQALFPMALATAFLSFLLAFFGRRPCRLLLSGAAVIQFAIAFLNFNRITDL